jgi:hypothetical protein
VCDRCGSGSIDRGGVDNWRCVRDGDGPGVAADAKLEVLFLDLEVGKIRTLHQVDDLLDLL